MFNSYIFDVYMATFTRIFTSPVFTCLTWVLMCYSSPEEVIYDGNIMTVNIDGTKQYMFTLAVSTALHFAADLFINIVTHSAHNVPFGTITYPLSVTPVQAEELGIVQLSDLLIVHFHFLSQALKQQTYSSRDEALLDLHGYIQTIASGFMWLEERMNHSANLGFKSRINWGIMFGLNWPEFLVQFRQKEVEREAFQQGFGSLWEMLEYYTIDDNSTVSTFIVLMDLVVPYDPHFPHWNNNDMTITIQPPSTASGSSTDSDAADNNNYPSHVMDANTDSNSSTDVDAPDNKNDPTYVMDTDTDTTTDSTTDTDMEDTDPLTPPTSDYGTNHSFNNEDDKDNGSGIAIVSSSEEEDDSMFGDRANTIAEEEECSAYSESLVNLLVVVIHNTDKGEIGQLMIDMDKLT
ncbi:hypothetical protein ARMGADRAFT_1075144 [Armillaria gallica]|uniref:Uncharacterized protein n=1 Tax=Armillaria gallica TaxID=47427 RepID=A0A2H3EA90_ARMGA|nr:hypothetical protein ARMGADRAFT_1075144 [Armillaria gallica]